MSIEAMKQEPDEWPTGCPECGTDSGCDCDSGTWNPPAAPVQEPPFRFRRFVAGSERAQDVVIERETTIEAAARKAAKICPPAPMTVLVYTPPAAQEETQRLSALVRAQQITIEKLEAQRQWVSLTDEALAALMRAAWGSEYIAPREAPTFAHAIEAKLCELNGGAV